LTFLFKNNIIIYNHIGYVLRYYNIYSFKSVFRKREEANMKRISNLVVMTGIILLLFSLNGCKQGSNITGLWTIEGYWPETAAMSLAAPVSNTPITGISLSEQLQFSGSSSSGTWTSISIDDRFGTYTVDDNIVTFIDNAHPTYIKIYTGTAYDDYNLVVGTMTHPTRGLGTFTMTRIEE
jgi:hypothetical protein